MTRAGGEDEGGIAGSDFDLSWNTIDCGGGESLGGDFQLTGTIGQADASSGGGGMSGGDFTLAGGFWPAATPPADPCLPDINGDQVTDVDDLLAVISSWGPCPECPADIAPPAGGDGTVDVDDLLAVISGWGACR